MPGEIESLGAALMQQRHPSKLATHIQKQGATHEGVPQRASPRSFSNCAVGARGKPITPV